MKRMRFRMIKKYASKLMHLENLFNQDLISFYSVPKSLALNHAYFRV